MKNYEQALPADYAEIAHVKFDNVPTGFLYDCRAVLPGILLTIFGWLWVRPGILQILGSIFIFTVGIFPYFSFHEIIHGAVYQIMTGQRVTIGFHKGGAYCGMPGLYVYRNVAVKCTAAPWILFSVLFGAAGILAIAAGSWLFLPCGLLLTLHLLGCRSDVHLLRELAKHPEPSLLVLDSGTEQWFFAPNEI